MRRKLFDVEIRVQLLVVLVTKYDAQPSLEFQIDKYGSALITWDGLTEL